MSDLISKAEVLSLLESMMETYWDRKQILSVVRSNIEKLPSAEPYTDQEILTMQELEQAQIQRAFELGREDAQPRWIPVTERLPIESLDRRILVSTVSPTGRKSVDIGLWEGGKWTTYFPIGDDKVTAWMPLPDCYKEADE